MLLPVPGALARPALTPGNANAWSAKTYQDPRYVFANDLDRGFDVYRWTPGLVVVETRAAGASLSFRPRAGQGTY